MTGEMPSFWRTLAQLILFGETGVEPDICDRQQRLQLIGGRSFAAAFNPVKVGDIESWERIEPAQAFSHIDKIGRRAEWCIDRFIGLAVAHAGPNHETIFYVEYRNDKHE